MNTSGWGHVHTIYRDPTNEYANSATQQEATGGKWVPAPRRQAAPHPRATDASTGSTSPGCAPVPGALTCAP
ncbi:hypothetical protein GCM10022380_74440 [Amycolatopsis tucumanensis]|uniref:Uncharacterized protein n=1 Tax=Amycolatopsis tucumanensis TaxID=401106 RepID=A0ABP7JHW0_9PSEU